jgi:hypothetical protein
MLNGQEFHPEEGFKNLNELNVMISINFRKEEDKRYVDISEGEIEAYVIRELNYRIPILEINQLSKNKLYINVDITDPYTASIKTEFTRNALGLIWTSSKYIHDRSFFILLSDIEDEINSFLDQFIELYIDAGNALVPSNKESKCSKDLLIEIDKLFDKMRNEPKGLGLLGFIPVVLLNATCKQHDSETELAIEYRCSSQSRSWIDDYIMSSAWIIFRDILINPQMTKVLLSIYVITTDEYGQEYLELGANIEMERSMYEKIKWENMSLGMLENLLSKHEQLKWFPVLNKLGGW